MTLYELYHRYATEVERDENGQALQGFLLWCRANGIEPNEYN